MISETSKTVKITRYLLGLVYVVFGLNYFLQFIPTPPPSPAGGAFLGALAATGYMFPLVKLTEIVGGALLLSGRAVPFALVLLAPVTVNIAAYHLALDLSDMSLALFLVSLQAVTAFGYRKAFAPLFTRQPEGRREAETARGRAAAHA